MSKNLNDFVNETVRKLDNYDEENLETLKELVRKAIDFYNLKSREEIETTDLGTLKVLHLHSIIEENLLSKVIELAIKGDFYLSVEAVYEGHIIRYY